MITAEELLTSPDGFRIATATPAQRAAARILDGEPLGDLASHPDVQALVGGPEALAQLPAAPPTEVIYLASVRSAKTITACAAAIRMALSVDVSRLGPGEVPRVSLLSLTLDSSAVAFRLLLETIKASRTLQALLISDTADTLLLRHPSGRCPVEIKAVAGSKAGGSLVARWSAGLVVDEAPRMSGAADAVVNLDHAREAILGRLLPGAQALYIGSPHAPFGPVYDWVQQHWRRPSPSMVVLRGTGPMLNPHWWNPERCDDLQRRNPAAFATDVMGDFADPESGLLSPVAVSSSVRREPLELPPDESGAYFAAVDPSEGSASGNGFALVLVQATKRRDDPVRVRVVLAREWRGQSPEHCWSEIATALRFYGVRSCFSDQYSGAASVDLARRYGLSVTVQATTAASKLEDWTNLATLMHSGQVELPPREGDGAQLSRDLLSVRKRVTQQGSTIVLPRTSDGRHADLAAAFCQAVARCDVTRPPVDYDGIRILPRYDPMVHAAPPGAGQRRGSIHETAREYLEREEERELAAITPGPGGGRWGGVF